VFHHFYIFIFYR